MTTGRAIGTLMRHAIEMSAVGGAVEMWAHSAADVSAIYDAVEYPSVSEIRVLTERLVDRATDAAADAACRATHITSTEARRR